MNRNIGDMRRALAQAIVLLEKKYVDDALHVLRTKTAVNDKELVDFLRIYRERGLRGVGHEFVDKTMDVGGRVARFFRR